MSRIVFVSAYTTVTTMLIGYEHGFNVVRVNSNYREE